MDTQPYIVYVKLDDKSRITAVNSSAFLADTDGWTQIDQGYGDRYHHAQGNYFPLPVMDERGIFRYKFSGGEVLERTASEMDADWEEPIPQPTQEERIARLEEENQHLKEALDLLLSGETEAGEDG